MSKKVCGNCDWWRYESSITKDGDTKKGGCLNPEKTFGDRWIYTLFTDTCPLWAEIGETDE